MRWARSAWIALALLLGAASSIQACTRETINMWGEKPANEGVRKDFDVAIGGVRENDIGTIEWRASVDLYVNVPVFPTGSALLGAFWKLYAVTGGTRVAIVGNASRGVGSNYVLGARNVVCDHYLLTIQAPNGEVNAPNEPAGLATLVAWGDDVTAPPVAIPGGFPDPPNADPVAMLNPFQPKGGAGEFGTGAAHDGRGAAALANFRLAAVAPNASGVMLVEMIGYTTAAGQTWLQLFNSGGPAVYPVNGSVADVEFPLTQNAGVSYFPRGGIRFKNGIMWALSSTPRVMTQVAGTTCWFDTSFYP